MSLFRTSGGKRSAKRLPSDAEGLALAVGLGMQWAKLRVFEAKQSITNGTRIQQYRLFFPIDHGDEWVQSPFDKSLCFMKTSSGAAGVARVSRRRSWHMRALLCAARVGLTHSPHLRWPETA